MKKLTISTSFSVSKNGSVWMTDGQPCISAARAVAEDVMRVLNLDEHDWRTRDNIIMEISDRINGMLDHAHQISLNEPQRLQTHR